MPRLANVYTYRVVGSDRILSTTSPIPQILSPARMWDLEAREDQCFELVWDERTQGYTFLDGASTHGIPTEPPTSCPDANQRLVFDGVRQMQAMDTFVRREGRRISSTMMEHRPATYRPPMTSAYHPPAPTHSTTAIRTRMGECSACGGFHEDPKLPGVE